MRPVISSYDLKLISYLNEQFMGLVCNGIGAEQVFLVFSEYMPVNIGYVVEDLGVLLGLAVATPVVAVGHLEALPGVMGG